MLAKLSDLMKIAEAEHCAIGAFNTPYFENLKASISAAERLRRPVIIMMAQTHEDAGIGSLDEIGDIMVMLAERASVPVCVHLDHGKDFSYIKKALDMGFTSVMYDGAGLPYEENCANTSYIVSLAAKYGANVEGEVGVMTEDTKTQEAYTDPKTAADFVKETGIDALACSFGSKHGLYKKAPVLDIQLLKKIRSNVKIPLVMHGGSGMSKVAYANVIANGIRKINYYTYVSKNAGEAIEKSECRMFFHNIVQCAYKSMERSYADAIRLFTIKKEKNK